MKLQIMSDIHNEFGVMDLKNAGADVLVLAGDIGLATKAYTFKDFILDACSDFDHVVMIMGNHEHYHGDLARSADLIRAEVDADNFHLLDNSTVEIDDVTFIGATLWADIDPIHEATIYSGMNDFRIIKNDGVSFVTEDFVTEFKDSASFIEEALVVAGGKVVVITHHSPTMKAAEQYRGSAFNSAYGSDLTKLMYKYEPGLWIHGHTHVNMDYTVGDTRVVCNPRGYHGYETNWDFQPELIIEV